tara:strand:- start:232 stop:888 length:657 start_codon:yes stop_codon:yes gene_type:complete
MSDSLAGCSPIQTAPKFSTLSDIFNSELPTHVRMPSMQHDTAVSKNQVETKLIPPEDYIEILRQRQAERRLESKPREPDNKKPQGIVKRSADNCATVTVKSGKTVTAPRSQLQDGKSVRSTAVAAPGAGANKIKHRIHHHYHYLASDSDAIKAALRMSQDVESTTDVDLQKAVRGPPVVDRHGVHHHHVHHDMRRGRGKRSGQGHGGSGGGTRRGSGS